MAIRLFDSLTRQIRELKPSQPDGVFRMYCCGPTVYGPAHIGNFRTFLVQDVLRRLLELEFGADKVKHVRNLTDVDDRTIGQAKREKRPLAEITRHWTEVFHADCRALNLLPPHVEPTATGHIAEQVEMINELLAKGLAYVSPDGSVYYKIAAFPSYGALSRIKERELKVTVATADDDHKDDASDFALWKAYKPEEDGDVKWPGPRGAAEGRPGWHIECSAMSRKHLGETIDLHAGGVDLLFPHHENEIAQSEGCTGHTFSHHWYHNEFLLVDGKKMSKSLGNLYTLADLTAKGFSPMAIRYALLSGHPRMQLNFTLGSLHAAERALEKLQKAIRPLLSAGATSEAEFPNYWRQYRDSRSALAGQWAIAGEAWDSLTRDDLNIPLALGFLFKALDRYNPANAGNYRFEAELANLSQLMFVLGLELPKAKVYTIIGSASGGAAFDGSAEGDVVPGITVPSVPVVAPVTGVEGKSGVGQARAYSISVIGDPSGHIQELAKKRVAAHQAKDYATADALRKELAAAGWAMLDGKDGYKLEPLKKA